MTRAMKRLAVMLLVLALGAACGGTDENSAEKIAAGRTRFNNNCAFCHGPDGTGGSAPTLNSKEHLSVADEQQLFNKINHGIPGTTMIGWGQERGGPFTKAQINEVVAYLRSLAPTAPSVPDWRKPRASTQPTTTQPTATSPPTTTTP